MADSTGDDATREAVERFAADVELALRELRADIDRRHAEAAPPTLDIPPAQEPAPETPTAAAAVGAPIGVNVRARRPVLRRLGMAALTGLAAITAVVALASTVGPLVLPYRTFFVRSGSMAPTIPTGAMVVTTEADPDDLRAGDIIVFDRPGGASLTVSHRIVKVHVTLDGPAFDTKGDANPTVDPWRVTVDDVHGKLAFHVPLVGYAFGFLGTPAARLVLLAVPVALLVTLGLLRRPDAVSRRGG